jgi:O-antigen biosynthesis protein
MPRQPAPSLDLMQLVGSIDGESFRQVGEEMVECMRDLVDLRPDARILEVGCGSGRVAIPLLDYVDERGTYDGFDVVPVAIEWCQEHLSSRNPAFRFHHADVANDTYHPNGAVDASEYRFPFDDATFDVVVLTSVFTHLLDDAAQRYIDEIGRVLRPGGRLFSTWFLLDGISIGAVMRGDAEIPFQQAPGPVWTMDAAQPAWAVAYDETFVRDLFSDTPLAIDAVVPGTWCGRPDGRSFQDILVGRKVASATDHQRERAPVSSKYDIPPGLFDPNSVHSRQVALIGRNKRVLELGCSFGYVSEALQKRGCAVTGIEMDPAAAERADEFCERVVVGDLDTIDLRAELGDARFDVALCGDVLEHLRDPVAVLRQIRALLAPEGYVVASIPNVAHGAIRLALMQERFEYRDLGLLDQTHIHLFTRHSIEEAFRDAGLVIAEMQEVPIGIFATEIPLRREDFPPEVVQAIESDPTALTYHFMVRAVIDSGGGIVDDLRRNNEALQDELVTARVTAASETARADEVTRWAEHLVGELESTKSQLEATRTELKALRRSLPARAYAGLRRRMGSGN